MDIHLKVLHGKPRGHCLRFGPGEFVVGRGPECHIRPNSELVSRQHCLLRVHSNGHLFVRDLGSANGTLVNGHRILGERELADGDKLQVGPVVLEVVLPECAVPTAETAEIKLENTSGDMPTYGN
ncbi:MAG: FHA domain-containing protein [Gemmataceae bacterium]|nr:FHA domain-containing protein [Gemmataceae bacterium]